jgi:UDP:flavonoid glycosyltransferase YjiC (YdhE family)
MRVTHDPRAGEDVRFQDLATEAGVLRRVISRHLEKEVPAEVEQVRDVIRALRPDVIALDGHVPSGMIAASLEGLPWAHISVALHLVAPNGLHSHELDVLREIEPERRALFARYGLEVELRAHEVAVSPYLNTVFAHPAFVGVDVVLPAKTFLVGAYAHLDEPVAFPWERLLGDRPIVYSASGTLLTPAPTLPRMLVEAADELGFQLVMSLGDAAPGEARGRDIMVPWAPQVALLERASVFVTHGGSNSVLEALVAGVPMLVLGKHLDLAIQAHFVEKSGVGTALDPDHLDPRRLSAALETFLDPAARDRARDLAQLHRPPDGAEKAAKLLLELSSSPRP